MREASYVLGTKAEGGVKQNVALVAMVTCCCDTFRGGRDRQVLVRESLSEQKSHVGPVMLSVMVHYYPIHNPVHTFQKCHLFFSQYFHNCLYVCVFVHS